MNTKPWMVVALLLLVAVGWAAACRTAPVTGRKQMLLIPESQEVALGATAFQDVVAKEPASQNPQYAALVNRVGQRIAAVAGKPDYQWEFRVVATGQQNAFCLPGGKVVVHDGIIPICQNEAGLAVVMSHEIAHALARHGGERMTQSYAVDAAKQAVAYATQTQEEQRREMVMKAYGAASQYGFILPYSRKHESEADHIGLMLLAKAGYDPNEAPRFWQRFGMAHQGTAPTEFFSTHPSDEHRATALTALLPEANQLYQASPQKYGTGELIAAAPATAPHGPTVSATTPSSVAPTAPPRVGVTTTTAPSIEQPAVSNASALPTGRTTSATGASGSSTARPFEMPPIIAPAIRQ